MTIDNFTCIKDDTPSRSFVAPVRDWPPGLYASRDPASTIILVPVEGDALLLRTLEPTHKHKFGTTEFRRLMPGEEVVIRVG